MTRTDTPETEVPYNPFLAPDEFVPDGFGVLCLRADAIPSEAAGFEAIPQRGIWTDEEAQVLADAARMIRFAAGLSGIPEREVIRNRKDPEGGIALVFRVDQDVAR